MSLCGGEWKLEPKYSSLASDRQGLTLPLQITALHWPLMRVFSGDMSPMSPGACLAPTSLCTSVFMETLTQSSLSGEHEASKSAAPAAFNQNIINIKYFEQQQLEVFNTKNTLTFVVINLKKKTLHFTYGLHLHINWASFIILRIALKDIKEKFLIWCLEVRQQFDSNDVLLPLKRSVINEAINTARCLVKYVIIKICGPFCWATFIIKTPGSHYGVFCIIITLRHGRQQQ